MSETPDLPDLDAVIADNFEEVAVEPSTLIEPNIEASAPEEPAEAAAPEETPVTPEVTPEPVPTPAATRGLAELVQRENLFLERNKAAVAEKAAQEELAALKAKLADPNGILEVANQFGVSSEQLLRQRLEANRPADPLAPVNTEIQTLRQEVELLRTQRERATRESAINEAKSLVGKHIADNAEQYPLINKLGYQEQVFNAMYTHLQQTGEVISEAAAAATIEQQLSGFREKLLGGDAPSEVTSKPTGNAPKTLSNAAVSEVQVRKGDPLIWDHDDALEAAIQLVSNT